jgi:predicted MFS family arabinose efflux permease
VAGFALVSSANQMLWLNFAPITTGSAHDLGVSSSTIGLLSEIFPLVYVVGALPAGLALDRWFRPTLGVGTVLTAAGAALRLSGHGFALVFVGQIIIAVGQPAVLNAVTGVATRSLTEADRPTGIAVGSAGTFLGFVLAFLFGLTLGAGRLHTVLVVSAVYSTAAALVLFATMRWMSADRPPASPTATPTWAPAATGTPAATIGTGSRRWARQVAGLRAVWADGATRTVSMLVFLGFGIFVALTTWVQTLLTPSGVDARTADGLLLTMVAAGIVSSVALPPLVARRRAQPLALAIAVVVAAVVCVVLAVAPSPTTGYIALGAFGFALLPTLPILLELIEQRSGPQASTATGLLWLAGNGGGLVVALAVQVLVHHPAPAWLLMALIACCGIPLVRLLATRLAVGSPATP